jgi:thymidylate synthase
MTIADHNMFPMFMNLQILAFVTLITKVAIGVRVKVMMFNTTFNNLHFYRGGQFYSLQKYIN